ncbi:MAG: hypothetical protein AAB415_02810 [Patescibacteria group bacterium]
MVRATLDAFVEGLFEDELVIESVTEETLPMAKSAIRQLARNTEMSMEDLLRRCRHPSFGVKLLKVLLKECVKLRRGGEFWKAIFTPPSWPEDWFSSKQVEQLLNQAPNVDQIITACRSELASKENRPLVNSLIPNAYWTSKVGGYLVKRNYPRAWDELKKATRGLLVSGQDPGYVLKHYSATAIWDRNVRPDVERFFPASKSLVISLTYEIHDAMVGEALISPVPMGNYVVPTRSAAVEIFETKKGMKRRARSYHQTMVRAGFDTACKHFLLIGEQFRTPHAITFTREGGMMLMIAEYCRQKQNEKRRQKYERLARDYEGREKK